MALPISEWSCDVVLRDGSTVQLRPVRPGDAEPLRELYDRLSPESRYRRFFGVVPKLDDERLAFLAGADQEEHVALVAESRGRLVADARYIREGKGESAEVAFTVDDRLHGRGLATRLLERLVEIARSSGIEIFTADVLGSNRDMLDVFEQSGYHVAAKVEMGVSHVRIDLASSQATEERHWQRSRLAAAASIRMFFEPQSLAVIGASQKPDHIGSLVLANLLKAEYRGRLYVVHPTASAIQGVKAYPRATELPEAVELAVIAVPAALVDRVVDDCIARGVRALCVITAGFGETGAAGRSREQALVDRIRAAGVRMVGPNCMGLLNTDPAVRMNATFSPVWPPAGHVAFASQSGALGLAILDYARRLRLGLSSFVSVGNKADVSGNDLIQYWAEDAHTEAILLYMESFGNPRTFARLARQVARQKPIIAVKAGRSKAGQRAAASHTGALASDDAVVEGLFRQAGVIRTRTLAELFDVATLVANQPVPTGRRVAIVTNAGGPGILCADACEAAGLQVPTLSDATTTALRAFLPPAASVANPVDMIASAPPEHFPRAMEIVAADEGIDAIIAIYIPPLVTDPRAAAAAIAEGAKKTRGKPVQAIFMSAEGAPESLAGVPTYEFPESAAMALARVAEYGEWVRRPVGTSQTLAHADEQRAQDIVRAVLDRGGGWLRPDEASDLMAAAGIAAARTRTCEGVEAAVAAARELSWPVALKAIGPRILHKSDVGGVRLNIAKEDALRAVYADFEKRLGAEMTGVVVQEMVSGGAEMMAGAIYDATFGPLLVCGSGGTLLELLGDVALRLHPLTDVDAHDMVESIRGKALMRGFRGAPKADEPALIEMLLRLSALLEACPEISELDLNPIKVLESGAKAVDVRVRVARRAAVRPSRRVAY
jgi:acetyl coenzyme A synthetase (ADP forming)-like protein